MTPGLLDLCERTPLVDTHEHLVEESTRLGGRATHFFPSNDWSDLLLHYAADDMMSAGMGKGARDRFFHPDTPRDTKIQLFLPIWDRVRHTGYGRSVRETVRILYGVDDLDARTIPVVDERFRAALRPGLMESVLEGACIVHAQVNSLERIFVETDHPEWMPQDISFLAFTKADRAVVARDTGQAPDTLDAWCGWIDACFDRWAPRAIAAKNQIAYQRRLSFPSADPRVAEAAFARKAAGLAVDPDDELALENHLFRHCLAAATRHGLPVKLHTGYYAGHGRMPLGRVATNAGDLAPLLAEFPETRFVLMHIGWPYQDEYLALAKHFPNVWIDLCWTWIIDPEACVRFVREFLTTVPSNKLLPFGGDYFTVECVAGHARIARHGIARALSELVDSGWLREEEAGALVPRLFHGNARALFPDRPGVWERLPPIENAEPKLPAFGG